MNLLEVEGLSRKAGENYLVYNISFTQKPLQKIAFAGATGSGKTTLLKMIAGLTEPSGGTILFEGERVEGPDEKLIAGHPHIAYLSQHFELRNHYRVEEILQIANKLSDDSLRTISEVCRIDNLLKRWSHELSGGERQRIVLAQQLLTAPRLLLLDEPYSNLDPLHKTILKNVIRDISEQLDVTCILVSHDPLDTVSWADEIFILQNGEFIQQGSPKEIYYRPVNEYTAALFGKYSVLTLALAKAFSKFADLSNAIGSFIRPEQFRIQKDKKGIKAQVKQIRFMGAYNEVELIISNNQLLIANAYDDLKEGEEVNIMLYLNN